MTVRLLLVLVAMAGLTTEAGIIGWRAWTYSERAADHARYLRSGRHYIYDSWRDFRVAQRGCRRKYELASSRPWLPVEPRPTAARE